MSAPRVVIGVPLYNHADDLPEALESLLIQSWSHFTLLCVEDQSTDTTGDIVRAYARHDARITYSRNPRRLGMIGNWRRAFELATSRSPRPSTSRGQATTMSGIRAGSRYWLGCSTATPTSCWRTPAIIGSVRMV